MTERSRKEFKERVIIIKNILYFLLLFIGVEVVFYVFFDTRPNDVILFIAGLCVIYLLVQSVRKNFISSSESEWVTTISNKFMKNT